MDIKLETKKIYLRLINENDTDLIIKWRNVDFVRNNLGTQDELTREVHENWFLNKVKTKEVYQYIIYEKSTNTPIGSTLIKNINYNNLSCEFGIYIGEIYFLGKGYGSDAVELMKKLSFHHLNLNKIYLKVFSDNIQAIKCYEKIGYTYNYTKMELINNIPREVIYMSILKQVIK